MPSARLPACLPPPASRSLPPLRSPPLRRLPVSSTPGGRLRALRPPPLPLRRLPRDVGAANGRVLLLWLLPQTAARL
ncbi:hypothetical protein GUJ93_ZPchr0006g41635 [Zizania palustris]|uniref:Uncharacterized protein n=1 Tax=Zizania palustris TaxID=103762 RepID=A0A8J5S7G5_ZIZPA|nr:hypothetical protein GUJ93_ZPchr0006g41635 [Zizania palustris]